MYLGMKVPDKQGPCPSQLFALRQSILSAQDEKFDLAQVIKALVMEEDSEKPLETRNTISHPSHPSHPSQATKESPLKEVPLEIILKISSAMQLEDAVAFSLTYRPFYELFGRKASNVIEYDKELRIRALGLLERDLDDDILCHDCHKFHRISGWETFPERCVSPYNESEDLFFS